MNEYIRLKSRHGQIEIRITTNDNSVLIQGRLQSQDPNVTNQNLNQSILKSDPDLNTKVGNIWNTFKTELANLQSYTAQEMEQVWQDFMADLAST